MPFEAFLPPQLRKSTSPETAQKDGAVDTRSDRDVSEGPKEATGYQREAPFRSGVFERAQPSNDGATLNGEALEIRDEEIFEHREPGELQKADVIEAFEVKGFTGLQVVATLEKKQERKGTLKKNEDNVILDPETGLMGVADGLGGERKEGDEAAEASKSAEAAIPSAHKQALSRIEGLQGADVQRELVENQLRKLSPATPEVAARGRRVLTEMVEDAMMKDPQMCKKALALLESIAEANKAVRDTGGKTTACIGFVHTAPDGTAWAVVANIGDSAAYKQRPNGELVSLTEDDSLFNFLSALGRLPPDLISQMKADPGKEFTIPGMSRLFSYRKLKVSMVASMGAEKGEAKLTIRKLEPGAALLIAADGVPDMFEDPKTDEVDLAELAKAAQGSTPAERITNLRKAANNKKVLHKDSDDKAIVRAEVLQEKIAERTLQEAA